MRQYREASMDNNTLIISMTSWPKRIDKVAFAMYSIYRQLKNKNAKLVLVLAKPEFPNGLGNCPKALRQMVQSGVIELLWCERNLFSHKKLMPSLGLFPNNPILVCDEDIIRPDDWVDMFINDHKTHPKDILVGGCVFDIGFDGNTFNPTKLFKFDAPDCAGKVIKNRRPANGFGGVLYPAGTFTDPRFYDIDNMMRLSRYSDESWQFCFNIIEGRTLRWTSKIYPYQYWQQAGTYETSMSKARGNDKRDSYREIYERLFNEFPEFREKLQARIQ